jgi:hypothetical protein
MIHSTRAFLRLCLLLLSLPFLASSGAFAQGASPGLSARVAGVDSEAAARKLQIETLDVRVRIRGSIAETIITARFANPGRDNLEGDFTLAMPAGSVVTGYALDIGDRMIDGVLVDQRQGRLAYERLVRGRIDPGLAEVGRDNLFRTRIFPIPPGGSRTIRLRFVTPLDPVRGYVLPFRDTGEIGRLTIDLLVDQAVGEPQIPGAPDARWITLEGSSRYGLDRRGARLDGDLVIRNPAQEPGLLVSRHSNGERFFEIRDSSPGRGGPATPPRSVAVLWDRSLSRADDDLDAEIALARRYLERVRPQAIELILFDSGGVERVRIASAAALVQRLRAVRYRGATSFAGFAAARPTGADACLLFSDGLVTIDRREGFRADCRLYAMSSARDADRAWLGAVARASGGEAFDLGARPADEVLARLTQRLPRVLSVQGRAGGPIEYSLLDGGENGWRIVGPMPRSGDVVVDLTGLPEGGGRRIYSARSSARDGDGPGALWAAERVALLAASDERSRDDIVAFSRRYSVASPDVSFIVLENGRDYAQAKIEPPAGAPAEWRETYQQVRAQMAQEETSRRAGRLQAILGQWREMRQWYATRFAGPRRQPRRGGREVPVVDVPNMVTQPVPSPPMAPPIEPRSAPAQEQSADQALVVTGSRIDGNARDGAGATTGRSRGGTIALEPWKPDRPYLRALDAARPAARERVFAEQQREHGDLPAFWLDVADWAWRAGRRADAIAYVLSALELPTRNNQTLAIVADRLMRYGETDRAVWLLERLLAAEDDRPQPRRNLALALARRAQGAPPAQARADLARAIALLTEVVMTPWDGAYDGIEMISLVEANRLIARYRALGGREIGLDPRLIALLDFDLRVTIEWQAEASDVDLWVDEPGGERAIFHNPRTAIGGRLSNDMTQGFGPEEYLLRRAPAGAYEVRANVFAADRLSPNGAQRVTARIVRDYGRATEREELVDIELLPDTEGGERRVGTVNFGPRARAPGPARPRARNRGRRGSRR